MGMNASRDHVRELNIFSYVSCLWAAKGLGFARYHRIYSTM